MLLELEHELANEYGQLDAFSAEQRRGKEVLLRNMKAAFNLEEVAREKLAKQFDPDYVPRSNLDYGISAEERARRDEARSKVFNWSKLDRDRRNA